MVYTCSDEDGRMKQFLPYIGAEPNVASWRLTNSILAMHGLDEFLAGVSMDTSNQSVKTETSNGFVLIIIILSKLNSFLLS